MESWVRNLNPTTLTWTTEHSNCMKDYWDAFPGITELRILCWLTVILNFFLRSIYLPPILCISLTKKKIWDYAPKLHTGNIRMRGAVSSVLESGYVKYVKFFVSWDWHDLTYILKLCISFGITSSSK